MTGFGLPKEVVVNRVRGIWGKEGERGWKGDRENEGGGDRVRIESQQNLPNDNNTLS